jgi:hypothetical protein
MAKKFETKIYSEHHVLSGPCDWRPVAAYSTGACGYVVYMREVEVPDPPTPEERQAIRTAAKAEAVTWEKALELFDRAFSCGLRWTETRYLMTEQAEAARKRAEKGGE